MNINSIHVTLEQAKLLKEKGFNDICESWYVRDTLAFSNSLESNFKLKKDEYARPEQWQVIEWLRIIHGIWVKADNDCYGEIWYGKISISSKEKWEDLEFRNKVIKGNHFLLESKSPQEAYSSTFDYILNNLI